MSVGRCQASPPPPGTVQYFSGRPLAVTGDISAAQDQRRPPADQSMQRISSVASQPARYCSLSLAAVTVAAAQLKTAWLLNNKQPPPALTYTHADANCTFGVAELNVKCRIISGSGVCVVPGSGNISRC